MVTVQKTPHTVCPYNVLGLRTGASRAEVDAAFERLIRLFNEENFMDTPQAWVQAHQAFMNLENAYKRIVEGDIDQSFPECEEPASGPEAFHPKLGQMLVAAGLITLEQLEEAIAKQRTVDLKIGEILKGMSLVTQMELDSFLLNQSLIKLPVDSPYQVGQRLIGLGLVTDDMVRIGLVEQRTTGKHLGEILVDRGWLASDILEALLGDTTFEEGLLNDDQVPANKP